MQELSLTGTFLAAFGEKGALAGQLDAPRGVATGAAGAVYVLDSANNRLQLWSPGNPQAHTKKLIYYSAKANNTYPTCGKRPEWANLPCETIAAAQPGDGLPELGVTIDTYNALDELTSQKHTVGAASHTITTTYDAAGRTLTSTVTATSGRTVPATTNEYNPQTGLLEKQTAGGQSVASEYNTLGQLVSYTDATGNTSTFTYDVDGRISTATDGKGEQKYTYDSTTGRVKSLKDSAAGAFSATYNGAGKLETQKYPNGVKATYTYDATGETIGVTYAKGATKWYEDSIVPSIHGQWLTQHSTLGGNYSRLRGGA